MVGFSARPDNRGGGGVSVSRGLASLVDVLGEPAEALAVALPLQHTAHEHLQWSCVQLLQGNVALRMEGKKNKNKKIKKKAERKIKPNPLWDHNTLVQGSFTAHDPLRLLH